MTMAACNTLNLFNLNKLEEGGQSIVNPNVGVTNMFNRMREVPALFKGLTNFKVHEFEELASFVCPTICNNGHSTCVEITMSGMPMMLTHGQPLLNFIMYLKYKNVIRYESF